MPDQIGQEKSAIGRTVRKPLPKKRNYSLRLARPHLILLCLAIFWSICAPNAQAASPSENADEEELKERIKTIIRTEPALIYETLQGYIDANRHELEVLEEFERPLSNRVSWSVDGKNPQKGPAEAPVTLIQYTDFQCARCARAAEMTAEVLAAYPGKVRVIFKNNPERSRPATLNAARAALAAHKQGKFWQYHDLLFGKPGVLNDRVLSGHANALGLDMKLFDKDRNSSETADAIAADAAEAEAYGFSSPPGYVINGVVVNGLYPLSYFTVLIDHLLEEVKQK
jgi:protein-disulfide isomerase